MIAMETSTELDVARARNVQVVKVIIPESDLQDMDRGQVLTLEAILNDLRDMIEAINRGLE